MPLYPYRQYFLPLHLLLPTSKSESAKESNKFSKHTASVRPFCDKKVNKFISLVLQKTFSELDKLWLTQVYGVRPRVTDGACVLACLLIDDTFYIAHVGDCRAVLCHTTGKVRALTRDHKPGISQKEDKRVEVAGGKIMKSRSGGESRVCAAGRRISVTRAIGDANLKKTIPAILSSHADVCIVNLKDEAAHWILVMASDGIWFRMGNVTVSSFLKRTRVTQQKGQDNSKSLAELLVREAYRRGSFDNISAIVIALATPKM